MAHPLESAITETIKNQRDLERKLTQLETDLKSGHDRENVLLGRIQVLDEQILDLKAKADHWMTCTIEIARQMNNVGVFVDDAMRSARQAVGNSKNKDIQGAINAVEQALIGTEKAIQENNDADVQHERKR